MFESSPDGLTSKLSSFVLSSVQTPHDIHALTVLGRVAKDDTFLPANMCLPVPDDENERSVNRVVRIAGEKIAEHAEAWMKSVVPDKNVLKKKFEEVAWMNAVIYGVGGYAGRNCCADEHKEFNGDFF